MSLFPRKISQEEVHAGTPLSTVNIENTNSEAACPAKRQRTMGSFIPKKVTPDQKKQIQPFRIVEDEGFKKLISLSGFLDTNCPAEKQYRYLVL